MMKIMGTKFTKYLAMVMTVDMVLAIAAIGCTAGVARKKR